MEQSATEQVRALFNGNEYDTADKLEADYLAEPEKYSDESWEAPQRGARLAAAVKRYKMSAMLRFISDIQSGRYQVHLFRMRAPSGIRRS